MLDAAARRSPSSGASARPGSFGERLVTEVLRSPGRPAVHLVNPRYDRGARAALRAVAGRRAGPGRPGAARRPRRRARGRSSTLAAARGDRSAVVFGSAWSPPATARRCAAAGRRRRGAGMALCGGGCMGFVDPTTGVRAIGYLERDPLPARADRAGHALRARSFSALLRTRRAARLHRRRCPPGRSWSPRRPTTSSYALSLPETRVVGLVLETMRDAAAGCGPRWPTRPRADIPVVALTVGARRVRGQALVDAHSGAIAGSDAGWEALFDGVRRAPRAATSTSSTDSLELFAIGRRPRPARAARHRDRARLRGRAGAGRRRGRAARRAVRRPGAARRSRGWRRCSTPAWSRRTRSTCGAAAPTPRTSSPTA